MKMVCSAWKICDQPCSDKYPHEQGSRCDGECESQYHGRCEPVVTPSDIAKPPLTGVELIAQERERQMSKEGWTAEHDDKHPPFAMAIAGACYILDLKASTVLCATARHEDYTINDALDLLWPWDGKWWKPTPDDTVRQLVKAGALIAAEIDRLQRGSLATPRPVRL